MKTLILLFAFDIAHLFAVGQSDTAITFKEVVIADSLSKFNLYENARLWFTDYFNSAKDVLQVADKESGELIGKGILKSSYQYRALGSKYTGPLNLNVTIRINTKDGKYKFEVYDITTEAETSSGKPDKSIFGALTSNTRCPVDFPMTSEKKEDEMWLSAKENSIVEINKMLVDLKKYMIKKDKSDW